MVEWNESEGAVKRTYHGLGKRSVGIVQFDTTKNRFLAAGDEFMVKYWDMDNVTLLTSIDADGGLPVCIFICSLIYAYSTYVCIYIYILHTYFYFFFTYIYIGGVCVCIHSHNVNSSSK